MANEPIPTASADVLAAQAHSGMEGVAAYQQAQATLAQQKQAAVQQAMQEAALRGSPAGAMDSQVGTIATPYDQRIASLAQSQGAYSADMAARDRRMADYNAATNKARELIPGEVEKLVAPIRAQGEATIRNTEREGEWKVSEIDANTRLALAKMAADAAAAARAAAAKKAASMKLSGTDLEAMLAKGAQDIMAKSIGGVSDTVQTNEAAASAAAAAKTKMNPGVYVTSWGASAAPKLQQATVTGSNRLTAPLNGSYSLSTGATAQPKLQQATVTRQTRPADVQAGGIASGRVVPGGDTGKTGYETVPETGPMTFPVPGGTGYETVPERPSLPPRKPAVPVTIPWGAPVSRRMPTTSSDLARRVIAQGQTPAPPELSRLDMQQWLSKFGSMSMDQIQSLIGTDPYAASLITGSPTPITSGSIGSMLYGEPDAAGNADPYSVNAANTARQIARDRLRAAGYDISDQDFANATTDTMKPGESLAQYQRREMGYKDPAAAAAANRKAFADSIESNKLAGQYDEQGDPRVDENGIPLNLSPGERASALNDAAKTWITKGTNEGGAGMPIVTGGKFGSEKDIVNLIQQGGADGQYPMVEAYAQLAANSGGLGFNTKEWKDQVSKMAPYGLSAQQIAYLKAILYQPSLDSSDRTL